MFIYSFCTNTLLPPPPHHLPTTADGLNLQGVAIGNGVMDMYFQEPSYAEYAYYHGLIPLGAKQRFERDWAACMEMVRTAFTFCFVVVSWLALLSVMIGF